MQPVNVISPDKSPVRIVGFDDIEFAPRFEFGEMAEVAGVCGAADGSSLGVGWGRLHNARIPWTIRYDEVLTVFEGELRLHTGCVGMPHHLIQVTWDALYPSNLSCSTTRSALIHFAIHPANWQENS